MTIEEAIKHCEEVAYQNEILMKRYDDASGYNRSHNENIRTVGAKGCEQLISLYRQIAEWLRELKYYKDRQDLINKSWQELIGYKEGIEKIKMRIQAYRERGETVLASGMEQALDILGR